MAKRARDDGGNPGEPMSKRGNPDSAGAGNQADVARKGLVSLNRLDYTLQPDLSVVTARTYKRHFFQQTSYDPGTRAIAILNSGAEYVDPQNSYLQFTISNDTSPGINFDSAGVIVGPGMMTMGVGSALNVIKRVILTSRAGDELERVDEVAQLGTLLDHYMYNAQWFTTVGAGMGYNLFGTQSPNGTEVIQLIPPMRLTADPDTPIPNVNKRTFIIPLGCIFGLFRSFDRLLPSMLCSGLRIEIEFESLYNAFCDGSGSTSAAPPGYKWSIQNPEIVLDSYILTDSIQRVMNEEAAMRGLEIVYTSFYHHVAQPKTSSTDPQPMNVEVRKAVSRALGVLTKVRPQIKFAAHNEVDYFASKAYGNISYQLRLGSLYFPHQPIIPKGACEGSLYESYYHTLHGFGKLKTPQAECAVTPKNIPWPRGNLSTQSGIYAPDSTASRDKWESYDNGLACYYTDLERSTTQRLTGVPVNNSRVSEVLIQDVFPNVSSVCGGWYLELWLHYVRLARVFLQNIEIEE